MSYIYESIGSIDSGRVIVKQLSHSYSIYSSLRNWEHFNKAMSIFHYLFWVCERRVK